MEPDTSNGTMKVESVTSWTITLPDGVKLEGFEAKDTWNGLTKFEKAGGSWFIAIKPNAMEQVFNAFGFSVGNYVPILCSPGMARHLNRKML